MSSSNLNNGLLSLTSLPKRCNLQCSLGPRYGLEGGRRLKSARLNRNWIVGFRRHSEPVTPAVVHVRPRYFRKISAQCHCHTEQNELYLPLFGVLFVECNSVTYQVYVVCLSAAQSQYCCPPCRWELWSLPATKGQCQPETCISGLVLQVHQLEMWLWIACRCQLSLQTPFISRCAMRWSQEPQVPVIINNFTTRPCNRNSSQTRHLSTWWGLEQCQAHTSAAHMRWVTWVSQMCC